MRNIPRISTFILIFLCIVVATSRFQPVRASGPIYIRADGTVDPPEAPIQRNGNSYILTDNITSDTDGIVVEKSDITIDGGGYTIKGDTTGNAFYLYGISNVTVRNARIAGFDYGIYLESTSQNVICRNNITGSTLDGIGLYSSSDNIVSINNIKENSWSGIGVYYSSGNNINENYITNNYYGITSFDSQNNLISHNNFINNTDPISSDTSPNVWNEAYPSGGNYWSNYNGFDAKCGPNQDHLGADGIGDTPYTIDSNNTDKYPLMDPWTPPYGHDVSLISAVSYKTVIGQGFSGNITAFSANRGEYAETFNVALYAGAVPVGSKSVYVESGFTTNITFSWNTTGFARGNYTLSAYAGPVSGETNLSDNNFTGDWVVVAGVGDLTGGSSNPYDFVPDGKVLIVDISVVARFFGQKVPPASANCDVTGPTLTVPDGRIQIDDVATVSKRYGQRYP
jgi:parallel beta-helix repeat protein